METQQIFGSWRRFGSLVAIAAVAFGAVSATWAGGDSLTCPDDITVGTDPGKCTADVEYDTENDGCGFSSCAPADFGSTHDWRTTASVPVTDVDCTSEDGSDGDANCRCSFTIHVEDRERPKVGTPAAIAACYLTVADADAAAMAAVLAVSTDNCAVTGTKIKTSGINDQCQLSVGIVAVDAAGNESDPPTLLGAIVNGDVGTQTCKASQTTYEVDENCEATVVFTAEIKDKCCVDLAAISASIYLNSDNATLAFDPATDCTIEYATTGNDNTASVRCQAKVSDLTSCPAKVGFLVDAKDCCGNFIDANPCSAGADVVDRTKPVITCPEPITLERGDKICTDDVQRWLDSATATDNCSASRVVYPATDTPLPIPHFGTMEYIINVPDSFKVRDLDLNLVLTHPAVGELDMTLFHGGRSASLTTTFNSPPCNADNYDVVIDDEGTGGRLDDQCVDNLTSPPSFKPLGALAAFDGLDAQGEWKLFIFDTEPGNGGMVNGWSLSIEKEVKITNDAPECGFPAGKTTTVTFTAEDDCGNTQSCKSDITIQPLRRGAGDQKGSLLTFSKIEIKWDADGKLIQDTLLDVSNDADLDGVEVQAYFVNGDRQLDEQTDMQGNVIQEFEPGWNTADCRFHLTKDQPHFWSAAKGSSKCQSFTVLDADGPGRLDPEATDGTRLLRGFVIMWAVKFIDPQRSGSVAGLGVNGFWEEIRWNHLKGDALIVNYKLGSAWEYNAWAYQARCGATGEPLLDCLAADGAGTCCSVGPVPGKLRLDGFQYDINFDELLLDFYASGSTAFSSSDAGVMVDTDLTLHSMDVDLQQDGEGPILTKAEFEIFNENESKFSGTRRCICCWDQTLLSNYVRTVAVPNHFLRSKLGTNKGYARINGVESSECDYFDTCGLEPRIEGVVAGGGPSFSRDTALAGVAFKILTFSGAKTNVEWAGGNLQGSGEQSSTIRVDVEQGSGEAHGSATVVPATNTTRALSTKGVRDTSGR